MEVPEIDDESLKLHLDQKTYSIRCRLCRNQLIVSDRIKFSHSGSTEPCGNCVFLDEECLPDWIQDAIENSSWTKSRLKCPRVGCTARVGGFDFIQGLLCACGEFTIPAIWIQDGKVDVRVINSHDAMLKPVEGQLNSRDVGMYQAFRETSVSGRVTIPEGSGHDHVNDSNITEVISESGQGSFSQAIGGTMNRAMVVKQSGFNGNMNDMVAVISESSQQSLHRLQQDITTSQVGFTQSVYHHNVNNIGMTNIRTGDLSTVTHITTGLSNRRTRNKTNLNDIAFMGQINEDQCIKKPVNPELDSSLNRFNFLSVEEPVLTTTVHDTSPNTHEHLTCAVCLDYYYKPYECSCGHVFCESCLRQLYHNRAGKLKCPICRSSVQYIEPANGLREEICKLPNSGIKQREIFEKTAKYRKWPLPPIGPLPFLRKRQTLVPSRDQNLVKLASILLLVVCYIILYNLPSSQSGMQ